MYIYRSAGFAIFILTITNSSYSKGLLLPIFECNSVPFFCNSVTYAVLRIFCEKR